MSKVLKGSFELMKKLNISAILKVVMMEGSISRADLAKRTGLTPASVTNITKSLIENGFLLQRGIGESSGGRPPIILEINPDARYIIGVNIGVGKLEVVITNIFAQILVRKSMKVGDNKRDKKYVISKLAEFIEESIKDIEIPKEKILGIGIAMHGIVNSYSGISEYSPYYNWRNVDIKFELGKYFEYPVFVDNDVRAMALGESIFGVSKNVENFITINVSDGIGAGIIINKKPYYGVSNSSGEIGHIVVDSYGERCNCGNYGCLETKASNKSIVKNAIISIDRGEETSLNNIGNVNEINIYDICKAANENDELSINLLKDAARYIGRGVASLVNILNPTDIVMVGEIFEETDFTMVTLENVVKSLSLKLPSEKVRIIKSSLGKNAAVIGAVTLVIDELINGSKLEFK